MARALFSILGLALLAAVWWSTQLKPEETHNSGRASTTSQQPPAPLAASEIDRPARREPAAAPDAKRMATAESAPRESNDSEIRFVVVKSSVDDSPLSDAVASRTGLRDGVIRTDALPSTLASADPSGVIVLSRDKPDGLHWFQAEDHAPVVGRVTPRHSDRGTPLELPFVKAAVLRGHLRLVGDLQEADPTSFQIVIRTRLGALTFPRWTGPISMKVEWRAEVASDGSFEIADLVPDARFEIEIVRDDEVLARPTDSVRYESGVVTEVVWTVGHSADVVARFFEANGGPAAGLDVYLDEPPQRGVRYHRGFTDSVQHAKTDDNGTVTFPSVNGGKWCVGISPEQTSESLPSPAPEVVRFEIVPESTRVNLQVTVHRDLYIRGIVNDWKGDPIDQGVQAIGADGGSLLSGRPSNGRFTIGPLLPGSYELKAGTFGDGVNAPVRGIPARAGDDNVIVQLQRGGVISGMVRDAVTGNLLACEVTQGSTGGGGYTSHIDEGTFRQEGICPGECSIQVETADGRVAVHGPFTIEPGQVVEGIEILVAEPAFVDVAWGGDAPRVYAELIHEGVPGNGAWVPRGSRTRIAAAPGPFRVKAQTMEEDGTWSVTKEAEGHAIAGAVTRIDL